jgi:hypothetical protein
MSAQREQGGGLSLQTLVIASLASMTAAVVIHEVWTGGAILGAAITPIIVAVTSELLKRPIDRASQRRERAARSERTRDAVARGETAPLAPPAPERPDRADPFGIWQADRPEPRYRRLGRRHVRIALVTGVLAFAVGAAALTVTEVVLGGNLGSGGRETTLGGGSAPDRDRDEDRPTSTEPTETSPAPTQEAEPAPQGPTTTTPPAQTTPPASTAPAATTPAPQPAPEEGTEAPAPAPAPG